MARIAGIDLPRAKRIDISLTYIYGIGTARAAEICGKADVVAKYGALTWDALDLAIRDVLVDLRYRGDYTGATREKVQSPAVKNNLSAFSRALSNENYWVGQRGVPRDRFRRRRDYLLRE